MHQPSNDDPHADDHHHDQRRHDEQLNDESGRRRLDRRQQVVAAASRRWADTARGRRIGVVRWVAGGRSWKDRRVNVGPSSFPHDTGPSSTGRQIAQFALQRTAARVVRERRHAPVDAHARYARRKSRARRGAARRGGSGGTDGRVSADCGNRRSRSWCSAGRRASDEEVDAAACATRGIPILRRASGGAAIVAGPGCLMYAVVLSYDRRPEARGIHASHALCARSARRRVAAAASAVVARAGTSDLVLVEATRARCGPQVLGQQPAREADSLSVSRHAALRFRSCR